MPPWGGIGGDGITTTGLNLTARQPALEVAVDPRLISLGSYGGAITGKHVDIYDWRGRASQDAWGQCAVSVTPAPSPGAGSLLGGVAPIPPSAGDAEDSNCPASVGDGSIGLRGEPFTRRHVVHVALSRERDPYVDVRQRNDHLTSVGPRPCP